jgi:hypothetical protein
VVKGKKLHDKKEDIKKREFNLLTSINLFFGSKQEAKDKMKDLKFIPFNITGTEEQIFNRFHLALATTFSYGYSKQNGTKQEDEFKKLLKKYNISRESGVTYEV